ncbi:unnamed protein product [Cylicocyclus nassatus]|uniref:Uncharacterized protein n=1 Tax=Cylicocyclus nassatus TaxID=53992 RepID=A0AA36HFR1_CYLNA|nr:unnamed protein product [Cylicocyclus nassatus]
MQGVGEIDRLIRLVNGEHYSIDTKSNAIWAVREFAYKSSEIHMIVDMDIIEVLAVVIEAGSIRMPCFSCLSLIAAHCEECKARCWRSNLFFKIVACLKYKYIRRRDYEEIKEVVGCLRHLLDSAIARRTEIRTIVVRKTVKFFKKVVEKYIQWADVAKDAMYGIAFVTDDMNHVRQGILLKERKLVNLIFEIIVSDQLQYASIKTVSNLMCGSDEQRKLVSSHPKFYEALRHCLCRQSESTVIAAAVCQQLASSSADCEILFDSDELFKLLLESARNSAGELQKTCAWTVVKLLHNANEDRINFMMTNLLENAENVCDTLSKMLTVNDYDLHLSLLKALSEILPRYPTQAALLRDTNFLTLLESRIVTVQVTKSFSTKNSRLKRIGRNRV